MTTDMTRATAAAAIYVNVRTALEKVRRADWDARPACFAAQEAAARVMIDEFIAAAGIDGPLVNVQDGGVAAMADHIVNTLIDAEDGEIDHMADARRRGRLDGVREAFVRHYAAMMTDEVQRGWTAA